MNDGVVERRGGTAFPSDFRGNALVDFRGQARVDENGQLRLAEHVDEAGSHDHAVGVDGAIALSLAKISYSCNFAGANTHVSGIPGRSGAVYDVAVDDYDVEGRRKRRSLRP